MRLFCFAIGLSLLLGATASAQARNADEQKLDAFMQEYGRTCMNPQSITRACVERFVAPDFIQNTASLQPHGRENFLKRFTEIFAALNGAPPARTFVMRLVDGNMVLNVFRRQLPDPEDPTKTYEAFDFDLFRIENGQIVEHWDAARKTAPSAR